MRLYLSGPMTGIDEFNYPAFADAEERLTNLGHEVLSPHNSFGGDTTRSYADYMRADIRMVLDADAVAVLPGWRRSPGARLEVVIAHALDLPIIPLDKVT